MSPIVSGVRQPRTVVKLNGQPVAGVEEWSVEENSFYQADTFRCSFATSMMPDGQGPAWVLDQEQLTVEIFVGFPANPDSFTAADLESIFYGRADDCRWSPAERTLELNGRDLTADLIDTKTTEKYPNRRASDIVKEIAGKHDLTPKVTATDGKVGKFYQQDHVRLQNEQSEWDLLTWLAREEHMAVFVRGKELHFEPAGSGDVYSIDFAAETGEAPMAVDATEISFARTFTLARDVRVTVKSWNAKKKKSFVKQSGGTRGHKAQEYSYTIPGLDADQALARAKQIRAELSQHEMRLHMDGPADNDLSIRHTIQVTGTGTRVDQTYFPDTIVRSWGHDGYAWIVSAKNHSPENDPAL